MTPCDTPGRASSVVRTTQRLQRGEPLMGRMLALASPIVYCIRKLAVSQFV